MGVASSKTKKRNSEDYNISENTTSVRTTSEIQDKKPKRSSYVLLFSYIKTLTSASVEQVIQKQEIM